MKIHIVKKGDTLYGLSEKYRVELEVLIAANPQIPNPNQLEVGMKVKIPNKPTAPPADYLYKHVVVQGDTLWKLGKAWGVPLAHMVAANPHLKNPNVLMTGDVVYVPKLAAAEAAEAPGGHAKADTSILASEEPLPVEAAPLSEQPEPLDLTAGPENPAPVQPAAPEPQLPIMGETPPVVNEAPPVNEAPIVNEAPPVNEAPMINTAPPTGTAPLVNEAPPMPDWSLIDFGVQGQKPGTGGALPSFESPAVHPFEQFQMPASEAWTPQLPMDTEPFHGKGKENQWHEPALPQAPVLTDSAQLPLDQPYMPNPGSFPPHFAFEANMPPHFMEPAIPPFAQGPVGGCGCGCNQPELPLPYMWSPQGVQGLQDAQPHGMPDLFPGMPLLPNVPFQAGLPGMGYPCEPPFGAYPASMPGFGYDPYGGGLAGLHGFPPVPASPQWAAPALMPYDNTPFDDDDDCGCKEKGKGDAKTKEKPKVKAKVITESISVKTKTRGSRSAAAQPQPQPELRSPAARPDEEEQPVRIAAEAESPASVGRESAPKRRARDNSQRAALAALLEQNRRQQRRTEKPRRAQPWIGG